MIVLAAIAAIPAAALTEEEVQEQVESVGRERVTGNVFIWFLCAIGFLKVAQKMDSFLSSLGISTGRTGGSLMAEAMIAARGIGAAVRGFGGAFRTGRSSSSPAGGGNILRQSLGTTIGHSVRNSAAQYAAGQKEGGLGGAVFQRSLSKGGSFASSVVSKIAQGDVKTDGVLKGENASKALSQYMGFAGKGEPPVFRNVEIGGGRISGTEVNKENPRGIGFGMYHAGQYMEPRGDFETVQAADGSKWYKQYAQDTVDRKPYQNAEGKVAYQEKLVKRVPDPPKRKDRL